MRTETTTHTLYTAQELKEQFPEAFERARYDFEISTWEDAWPLENTLEDVEENVLPELGLSLSGKWNYSIGNYNDYVAPGTALEVDDMARFLDAVKRGVPNARDYGDKLPRVKVDRRSALVRALLCGDAWMSFRVPEYSRGQSVETVIEIGDDAAEYGTPAYDKLERQSEELSRALDEWVSDFMDEIVRHVMAEYEYRTSADMLVEMSDANGWEYDETGKLA